eukprot:367319_1
MLLLLQQQQMVSNVTPNPLLINNINPILPSPNLPYLPTLPEQYNIPTIPHHQQLPMTYQHHIINIHPHHLTINNTNEVPCPEIIKEGNEYYERNDTIGCVSSQRLINDCNTWWCPKCQKEGVDTACEGVCGRWLHKKCTKKHRHKRYCSVCY